jgi:hypothetical protein
VRIDLALPQRIGEAGEVGRGLLGKLPARQPGLQSLKSVALPSETASAAIPYSLSTAALLE